MAIRGQRHSGQRTFPGHSGRRGKPSGVGRAWDHDQAVARRLRPTSRATAQQHRGRPWARARAPPLRPANQRQEPFGGDRRRRQRLRDRHAEAVRLLLLGPPQTTSSSAAARSARGTPPCAARLRAGDLRSGSAAASGIPGAPPPEPTSTIGPSSPARRQPHAGCPRAASAALRRGRGSRSARRSRRPPRASSEGLVQQDVKDWLEKRRRSDSALSLAGRLDSEASLSSTWTILRSTAVIGSSSTRSPRRRASSAARRAIALSEASRRAR